MPYNELLIVIEQHSIGGVESATNYILNGKRILKFKRSKITWLTYPILQQLLLCNPTLLVRKIFILLLINVNCILSLFNYN